MQASGSLFEQEIVDHRAVTQYRLGANAGRIRFQILQGDAGAVLSYLPQVTAFPYGISVFPQTTAKVAAAEFPETGEGHGFESIPEIEIHYSITLSLPPLHGIGADSYRTVDHFCQVHAQEGLGWVGNGVDQVRDEVVFM